MGKLILKRLWEAIPILWLVATLTFALARVAPGGPFDRESPLPPEVKAAIEAHYGLDKPLLVQYGVFLKNLVCGDLGPSYKYPGWTVQELIADKFPVSLELGALAMALALVLGLSAGLLAASRPHAARDYLAMGTAMTGLCLPTFVLGPLLLLVFALKLGWFNAAGWGSAGDTVLPSVTLGLYYAAFIARLTRGSLLEVRTQDFMRTARAKGASPLRVYLLHGSRNALGPVVSYLGPTVAGVLTGSFVVETVFQIPGLGRFFVSAALDRDYPMVLGTVVFYAALILLCNLLADLLLAWLNPRLRKGV